MTGPSGGEGAEAPQGAPQTSRYEYLGVGCFSTFVGFAGGGMIGVLIAKIVGLVTRCPSEAETGAPCNWFMYMLVGMVAGTLFVPTISIWFFRRGRIRARNNERG